MSHLGLDTVPMGTPAPRRCCLTCGDYLIEGQEHDCWLSRKLATQENLALDPVPQMSMEPLLNDKGEPLSAEREAALVRATLITATTRWWVGAFDQPLTQPVRTPDPYVETA